MAVGLLALAAVALYIFGERTYLHVSRTGRRVYWALTAAAGAAALAEAAARIDIAWLVLSAVRERVGGEREREEGEAFRLSFDGLPKNRNLLLDDAQPRPQKKNKKQKQIIAASYVEDEVQKTVYLTRFSVGEGSGGSFGDGGGGSGSGSSHGSINRRGSPEAEGKAAALDAAAAAISRHRGVTLSASQALARVGGGLSRERARILEVLAGCDSSAELNFVLSRVNLPALLEATGGDGRVAELLTSHPPRGRLPDLSVLSRAAFVDALQKLGMRHRPKRQGWAAAVLLVRECFFFISNIDLDNNKASSLRRRSPLEESNEKTLTERKKTKQATRGLELTRLKSLLDDGGDHHSFFRLAYHDLQGVYRTAVLQHVAAEGDALLAAWHLAHPGGPPGVTLKVVSDIDDTLVCSGGHYPAGVDRRLPKGCPYPGACALLNELDAGHALRVSEAVAARLAELDKSNSNNATAAAANADDGDESGGEGKRSKERDGTCTPRGSSPPPSPRLCAIFPPPESSQFSFSSSSSSSSAAAAAVAAAAAAAASGNGGQQPSTTTDAETALIRRVARGAAARTRGALLAPWSSEFEQAAWHRITQAAQAPSSSSSSLQHQSGSGSSNKQPSSPTSSSSQTQQQQQQQQQHASSSAPLPPPPPPGGRLHQRGGHLAFLSARPETYKGLTEATSYRHIFAPLIDGRHLHQAPLLLLGSMRAGPRALWRYLLRDDIPRAGAKGGGGRTAAEEAAAAAIAAAAAAAAAASSMDPSSASSSSSAATATATLPAATKSPPPPDGLSSQLYFSIFRRKLEQFEKYAALHREAAFVFLGDNGQGDVLLAEELHRRSRARTSGRSSQSGGSSSYSSHTSSSPFNLVAAFILRVTPVTATLSSLRCSKANKAAWLASWRSEGIYFHKTFVGVAARAATLGLIDAAGLQRVALEASWGLRAARAAHAFSHVDWSRVARQLNKDARAANGWLPGSMRLAPLRVGGDDGSAAFDVIKGDRGGDRSDREQGAQLQTRRSLPRATTREGGSPPPRSPSPEGGTSAAAKAEQQQPMINSPPRPPFPSSTKANANGAPVSTRAMSTPPVMLRLPHSSSSSSAAAAPSASASIPAPIASHSSRRASRGGSPSPGGSSPLFGTSPVSAWPPSWSAGLSSAATAAAAATAASAAAAPKRPGSSSRGSSPAPAVAPAVAVAAAAAAAPAEPALDDKEEEEGEEASVVVAAGDAKAGDEDDATANGDEDDEGDAGTPPPSPPPRTPAM